MPKKLPVWADLLLALWVGVVLFTFFCPLLWPVIGLWTAPLSFAYFVMLIITAVTAALKAVHRHEPEKTLRKKPAQRPQK